MITTGDAKSFKSAAREAKKRLKTGFWTDYQAELDKRVSSARDEGQSESSVRRYFTEKVKNDIKGMRNDEENFYQRVRNILLAEGEVSDAIGRLTDKELFSTLDYAQRQRYLLKLSEKYLLAVERFKRESQFEKVR